jgi:hypothetical protein
MNFLPSVEPEWMQAVPSAAICQYFFVMFGLIAFLAGIVVLGDLVLIVKSRGRSGFGLLIRSILAFALPFVNALFLYILCSRSLLEKK